MEQNIEIVIYGSPSSGRNDILTKMLPLDKRRVLQNSIGLFNMSLINCKLIYVSS